MPSFAPLSTLPLSSADTPAASVTAAIVATESADTLLLSDVVFAEAVIAATETADAIDIEVGLAGTTTAAISCVEGSDGETISVRGMADNDGGGIPTVVFPHHSQVDRHRIVEEEATEEAKRAYAVAQSAQAALWRTFSTIRLRNVGVSVISHKADAQHASATVEPRLLKATVGTTQWRTKPMCKGEFVDLELEQFFNKLLETA